VTIIILLVPVFAPVAI